MMRSFSVILLTILPIILILQPYTIDARIREGECEVCLNLMNNIKQQVKQHNDKTEEQIEKRIKSVCSKTNDNDERRLCYYIGGSADAATYLLGSISKPIKNHLPADKICDKLKSIDPEICHVKYSKPEAEIDYSTLDYDKMRVRELKNIIAKWGEECKNCVEKSDYLRLIKEVLPKYVKRTANAVKDAVTGKSEL